MNTKMKLLPAIIALSLGVVACSDESAPVASSSDTPETVLANAKPELGDFGVDLSQQDPNTKPGDDFFRFANGKWLDEFELPADRSNYGSFSVLGDRSDERVNTIIEELSAAEPAADTIEQKISDYYLSYMNTEVLDERGIGPLREKLAQLSAIDSRAALIEALGRSQLDATASPFGWYVGADRRDPDRHQLVLSLGGIGLPDRDYYLLDTEQYVSVRSEYVAHIERMLGFAGIENAAEKAQAVLALETAFAENLWPRADRRNRDLTFNPMTYTEFKAAYPNMDWDAYWAAAGISEIEDLNVSYPTAMAPIIALLDSVAVEDWVSYMSYQHISNLASVLSQEIDNENFHFYSTVLNGVPEQRQRWERGVERVGSLNSLGEAVGQIYVQKHFPEAAKQQMQGLVENLRTALANSIASLDWMGEETKNEARLKLESFRPKIAYPDEWRDLSAIEISRDDLFANARSVREFNYADEISRLGKPTNREEWGMTPQTVNAYYNSSFNEIVFPAGILQPPFFDPAADMAVNYGGIGAVIGHEMGHGFDDQGSKSDSLGVQRNWWTDDDRANFEKLTTALAAQYDQFEPVPGYFVDGNFTLGENIGDVGGLSLAYRAYKLSLGGEEAPVIDGLTGDQRFFLSWAQVWQRKYREDALIQRLTSDPHSPSEFRVNGVVRNFDEWYEAFDVQPEDALYLAPEDRVRIW
ncbi:MAG: M13 family metallopeptidase [Gammaproteobacteria bacterium]|jgi:putative endopeptidase|nr:M13 family metallopeptidase [Gammaproteobacteria bacterium]MBT6316160.1 M13 family metallopeptidase [Gammaproteobacteria bacterium]